MKLTSQPCSPRRGLLQHVCPPSFARAVAVVGFLAVCVTGGDPAQQQQHGEDGGVTSSQDDTTEATEYYDDNSMVLDVDVEYTDAGSDS